MNTPQGTAQASPAVTNTGQASYPAATFTDAGIEKLEAALALHLGAAVRIEVLAGPAVDTPAARNAAERERRQREAEQIIQDDPVVRALMSQYSSARIVPGSVRYQ